MCVAMSDRYTSGNADLHFISASLKWGVLHIPVSSKLHDTYSYVVLSSMQLPHKLMATAQRPGQWCAACSTP